MNGQGIASRVKAEKSEIQVCGKVCTLREDLSDSSKATCEVPAIQTVASNQAFEIVPAGNIIGATQTASSSSMATDVFDGVNLPGITSTGSNCYI